MKKITMGMFSLAALVGMTAISAKAVRAEAGASLEGAKQESGVEFGEMGGPKAGGSSAARAFDAGISRPAMTILDKKALQERPEVPVPYKQKDRRLNLGSFGRLGGQSLGLGTLMGVLLGGALLLGPGLVSAPMTAAILTAVGGIIGFVIGVLAGADMPEGYVRKRN